VVAMILAGLAAVTGGLHLDGLADSADGLLCHRSPAESLRIMKDSRVGAMGVIAIILLFLGKYAALSSIDPSRLPLVLLLMPLAGRNGILLMMARLAYVGQSGGVGDHFYRPLAAKTVLPGWIALFLLLLLFFPALAVILPVALFATVLLFARCCRQRLGGATGDTLGAVCEVSELVAAIICSTLLFS
jgi:adenosylcobinamide-GDP ribazoletransferase